MGTWPWALGHGHLAMDTGAFPSYAECAASVPEAVFQKAARRSGSRPIGTHGHTADNLWRRFELLARCTAARASAIARASRLPVRRAFGMARGRYGDDHGWRVLASL